METLPIETTRDHLEVVPTTTCTYYEAGKTRVVYGFAYRCIACEVIWLHRKQAHGHACAGAKVHLNDKVVIQRVL